MNVNHTPMIDQICKVIRKMLIDQTAQLGEKLDASNKQFTVMPKSIDHINENMNCVTSSTQVRRP